MAEDRGLGVPFESTIEGGLKGLCRPPLSDPVCEFLIVDTLLELEEAVEDLEEKRWDREEDWVAEPLQVLKTLSS